MVLQPTGVRLKICLIGATASALLCAACGDSTGPRSDPLVWTAVQSPAVGWITGISGLSASDIWAVDLSGSVLHFDGATWSTVETGFPRDQPRAVWARTPADVWIVAADPSTPGFPSPTILHYDGTTWTATASPTSNYLTSIWGSSASDIWAVGSSGEIIHYDGTTWTSVASGTLQQLWAVWGTSASDVWAGGESVMLHYNGSGWSPVPIHALALAIWGTSQSDVWAATSPGELHYDGQRWSTIQSGFLYDPYAPSGGGQPYAVWGASPSSVWIGGWNGVIAGPCCGKMEHYDGSSWSDVPLPAGTPIIKSIWGSSASDVWAGAATGILIHGTAAKP